MFKFNKITFAMVIAGSCLSGGKSIAQNVENSAGNVEKIEVTGSRIKRTDLEGTVPIAVISRAEIEASGSLNVADLLKITPVAIAENNTSSTTFSTSAVGINTTALRNLGTERTLVLVNGRRYVSGLSPSDGYGVDLNSIPAPMIERIEILKSASSAIYGSDAVAGVINIILRDEFEGVEINTQLGTSEENDKDRYLLNLTAGGTWASGNAWVSLGFDEDKGIRATDRDFSKNDIAILLDEDGNEYSGNVFSSFPPQGRVGGYNGDGTPYTGDDGFNRASYRQLITPLKRKYVAAGIEVELASDVSMFAEVQWNSTTTDNSTIEPTPFDVNDVWIPDRGGVGGLDVSSPLLPDLLRQNLIADGVTNLNEVTWVRRLVEFGARSTDLSRDTTRLATGINWALDDNWTLDTYLTWGQTQQHQEDGGQVNLERARYALDVERNNDGSLQCVDDIARLQGCAPFNVFGIGSISDEAVEYLRVPAKSYGRVEQFVFSTAVSGEIPFDLAGGMPGLAAGIEYREEKGLFNPGDLAQTGSSSTNKAAPTDGKFDTVDLFAEVSLPILESLRVDLAVRYADNSIVGDQTTWNLGTEFRPIEGLLLRASAARAVRTPNISDLFGGRGETFATVSDPCNGVTLDSDGNAAQNCLSIAGVLNRVEQNGAFTLSQVEAQGTGGTVGGNVNVKEETSDSWSLGAVYQFNNNLSATIDYYDFEIDDAIATTTRTVVLQRCFDVSNEDFDPTCGGAVLRSSNGVLAEVNSGTSNENILKTSGIDVEVNYTDTFSFGNVRADVVWNYIDSYELIGIFDGSVANYRGELPNPKHRATANFSLEIENMSYSWRLRYWHKSTDSNEGENFNFVDFNPLQESNLIGSVVYSDVSAAYSATDSTKIKFGINNLFDKQPPILGQSHLHGNTGINTYAAAFDVVGRYYYFGTSTKF